MTLQTLHEAPAVPATFEPAIRVIESVKSGLIPPFLSPDQLQACLESWHQLWNDPTVPRSPTQAPRFIVDNRMYEHPAFVAVATHPVVQAAARAVLGPDIMLINYAIVATPKNGETITPPGRYPFHIDHVVFSHIPVEQARDTMVCIWINFEDMGPEHGPFCIAHDTDKWRLGYEFFRKRPGLSMNDFGIQDHAKLNVGPAGSTAVYSGFTWHSPTNNITDRVRKGINLNFLRKPPLDCHKRLDNDICHLPQAQHEALDKLINIPGYLEPRCNP